MHVLRARDEGIDQRRRNGWSKTGRASRERERAAEFVLENELDLACCRCQGKYVPVALEAAERPSLQADAKPFRTPLRIARREAGSGRRDSRPGFLAATTESSRARYGRAGAPREENAG